MKETINSLEDNQYIIKKTSIICNFVKISMFIAIIYMKKTLQFVQKNALSNDDLINYRIILMEES